MEVFGERITRQTPAAPRGVMLQLQFALPGVLGGTGRVDASADGEVMEMGLRGHVLIGGLGGTGRMDASAIGEAKEAGVQEDVLIIEVRTGEEVGLSRELIGALYGDGACVEKCAPHASRAVEHRASTSRPFCPSTSVGERGSPAHSTSDLSILLPSAAARSASR